MLMDDAGKCERLAQRSSTREMHVDEREQQRGSFPPQARELRVDNKRVETQGPSNQAHLLFPGCVFTRNAHNFTLMASSPLPPLVPPLRYCLVEEGLYRGAYPSMINLRFLTRLGLRSMVSLLPEPPAPHLIAWCEEHGIRNHFECVKPFSKDEVTLTHERAASLLQLLVLPERQPVYVHCLDGVGVTGLLIMCLRKVLHWAPPSIFAEFSRFARDAADTPLPPPPHVLAFLHAWKPELEFLPQYLPAHPPLWLELALQVSAVECRRVPLDAVKLSAVECRRVPLSRSPRCLERSSQPPEADAASAVGLATGTKPLEWAAAPTGVGFVDGHDVVAAASGEAVPLGPLVRPSSIGIALTMALDALALEGVPMRPRRVPRA